MATDGMIHTLMMIGSGILVILKTIWEATVLVLLMGGIYDVHDWNGPGWHDTLIHNNIDDDEFRKASNIKFITPTISEAEVSVRLYIYIYIYIYIHIDDDWFRHLSNIKLITSKRWEVAALVLLMGRIYEACFKMASCGMIYTSSFMKTGYKTFKQC
jgi:hypothetical protein